MSLVLRVRALGCCAGLCLLLLLLVSWLRLRLLWGVMGLGMNGLRWLDDGYLVGQDAVDVGADGSRFELVHVAGAGEDYVVVSFVIYLEDDGLAGFQRSSVDDSDNGLCGAYDYFV